MQIKRRRPKHRPEKEQGKRTRINQMIKVPEVMVIDQDNQNIGILSTTEALSHAKESELDLVEVNPKASPPICKIMNYGKYKYEQDKLAHKQKVASKKTEVKAIRLSFKIKGGDLETRINQAKRFLEDGHQVKLDLILKGREKAHATQGADVIRTFIKEIGEENIKVIQPVQKQGGRFSSIIASLS